MAEIFLRGYYLNFFQSYVVSAGSISFEGYKEGRSKYFDLFGISDATERAARRTGPIRMSAASVFHALPEFILKFNICRINYVQGV